MTMKSNIELHLDSILVDGTPVEPADKDEAYQIFCRELEKAAQRIYQRTSIIEEPISFRESLHIPLF